MGLLYHVNHLEYFEVARSDWIRKFWRTYREIEDEGYCLVVLEATIRYIQPAYYDEELVVKVKPTEWGRSRITFAYEIHRRGKREPICTGETRHCFIDRKSRAVKMPEELRKRLDEAITTPSPLC
jgi:acyl-CoA thioester hydrolase